MKENLALERRIFWEQSQTIWQKTAFQQQSCTSRHSSDLKALLGDKTTGRTVADAVNEVKNAPVLMLDDIGADSLSNWSRDDILGVILQHRMQEELPTFFSSNLSMEELESSYLTFNNRMESDPLKAKRIMERIKFLATEIIVDGPNLRND